MEEISAEKIEIKAKTLRFDEERAVIFVEFQISFPHITHQVVE